MIKLKANNERTIGVVQHMFDRNISVHTCCNDMLEDTYVIPEGDFVLLLNYYRYVKDNDIRCDFINPNGNATMVE